MACSSEVHLHKNLCKLPATHRKTQGLVLFSFVLSSGAGCLHSAPLSRAQAIIGLACSLAGLTVHYSDSHDAEESGEALTCMATVTIFT